MIIEIDNVELSFSNKLLLSGIYLKAETGKITGLLGPNGCGKTSLMKLIFGSLKAQTKLLRINNKPHLQPLFQSGLVKYLPQHPLIPDHIKLKFLFRLFEVSWVDFLTSFIEFASYEKFTMKELSGGERRVVESYLVIKSKAELLLLDEPFTHLSPIFIEKFKPILEQEKKEKAVIISDHLFHHVLNLADDLYFLKNGYIQLIKDPLQLEDYKYLSEGTL